MAQFNLTERDRQAIDFAIKTARRFLKQSGIQPYKIIGLGHALYALENLPEVSDGIYVQFGIVHQVGPEHTEYVDFAIGETSFEMRQGSWQGDDDFTDQEWFLTVFDGTITAECNFDELEKAVSKYLELGAEISVHSES